ncbi:hypothetical protein DKX38_004354 [Salix brachista]|uniref:Uncharacterized protein n=1 Tax=Salix brachista TaxID=2182728 RepID=A0A5N5N9R8_9ROSI|nr:hypothetical protein DKX38_004354 [Salix brachista]
MRTYRAMDGKRSRETASRPLSAAAVDTEKPSMPFCNPYKLCPRLRTIDIFFRAGNAHLNRLGAGFSFPFLGKRKGSVKTKVSMRRLRAEMAEIGEQQKRIRKGQMEIRERFEEIDFDCDQLKKETFLISKQAARNQQRLNLMFKIVRAREENNFSEVDKLTQSLRECMKHDMENNL